MHGMLKRCSRLKISDVGTKVHLFDSLVRPVLSYACEVWAVDMIGKKRRSGQEVLYLGFLKRLLGVCTSTTTCAVLGEFGRFPIELFWMQLVIKYWNRLLEAGPSRLIHNAFCESMASKRKKSWYYIVHDLLQKVHLQDPSLGEFCPATPVNLKAVMDSIQDVYLKEHQAETGSKTATYWQVKGIESYECEEYLSSVCNRHHRRALAQLRTGSHWLPVQQLRFVKHVDKCMRKCAMCDWGVVGDEHHMIFDCPALQPVRQQFLGLFEEVHSAREFMNYTPAATAAAFAERSRLMHKQRKD
jgi:hypothetical protein